MVSLDGIQPGQRARIRSLPAGDFRAQAIRLGLYPGAEIVCIYPVPGGPVVIARGNQELAIGRSLARRIQVESIADDRPAREG